ncbi:MAG: TRAP transporter small permease [Deltaproteobacteria bacterium]|nr:TRAP transporter small permease [Deltaproteobacteria bacterium]
MEALEKLTTRLAQYVAWLGGGALVAMMAVTCVDVVLRAVGHPLIGAVEVEAYLGTLVLALALPWTQARRGQVGVEILVHRLSDRAAARLEVVAGLGSLVVTGVAAWQSWLYAGQMAVGQEVSATLQIPVHLMVRAVALGFGVLTLVVAAQTAAAAAKVVRS